VDVSVLLAKNKIGSKYYFKELKKKKREDL